MTFVAPTWLTGMLIWAGYIIIPIIIALMICIIAFKGKNNNLQKIALVIRFSA